MRWDVVVADARTAEERTLVVEAGSAAEAEARARSAGYLVSSAAPAAPGATGAGPADALSQLAAAAQGRPEPVPYRPPPGARPAGSEAMAVPDYLGLRSAAFALSIFAGLAYVAGGLMVLVAIFTLLTSTGSATSVRARANPPSPGLIAGLISLLLSLWPLAAGAMLHGFSAACLALRDIARNSFSR